MTDQPSIHDLVSRISEALREYDRLTFDETLPHEMGPPASPQQIALLEGILTRPVPPSYREFLSLHNGWSNFHGGAKLLAVEDHSANWVRQTIEYWNDLWEEDLLNPFESGMIPVLLGVDENSFVVVDPTSAREDGEMDFVEFDYMHEENRFSDFGEFLQRKLDILQFLIDRHKKGVADEDAATSTEG